MLLKFYTQTHLEMVLEYPCFLLDILKAHLARLVSTEKKRRKRRPTERGKNHGSFTATIYIFLILLFMTIRTRVLTQLFGTSLS